MTLLSLSLFSNSNLSNVETFIIFFEFVEIENAEMMTTNLVNLSLNHFLMNNLHICMNDDQTSNVLQTNLKTVTLSDFVHICMKNIDFFTYIIIDRYTFEMFYDIMIDSDVSTRSTAEYVNI